MRRWTFSTLRPSVPVAVPVVALRESLRRHHVHRARVDEMLVPIRRVVGGRHDDAAHVLFERQLEDAVCHVHIGALCLVCGAGRQAGRALRARHRGVRRAIEGEVDDRILPPEEGSERFGIVFEQVRDLRALNGRSIISRRAHIDQRQVIPLPQGGEHPARDIPRRPGDEYLPLGHSIAPSSCIVAISSGRRRARTVVA
jgi:hypothetical protein